MIFHIVTYCGWRFVGVNCLKEALQGVCAAGCWPERQQDIRVWDCRKGLVALHSNSASVNCKGLVFVVGLRGCF